MKAIKIEYKKTKYTKALNKLCPYGQMKSLKYGVNYVGSIACFDCDFFIKIQFHSVICNR